MKKIKHFGLQYLSVMFETLVSGRIFDYGTT